MEETNTNTQAPKKGSGGKIIGIVILLALLAIAGWYFNSKISKNGSSSTKSGVETKKAVSMLEVMNSGASQKCEVSFKNESSESKGTMYFAENKMRGDFTVTTSGQTISSHILNDGFNLYSWVDGTNVGAKLPANVTKTTDEKNNVGAESIDLNAKYDFKCTEWTKESSLLIAPLTINFIDPNNLMKDVVIPKAPANSNPAATSGDKAKQCEVCDTSPESLRAQCRAALQCE